MRIAGDIVPLPLQVSLAEGWTYVPCPYRDAVPLSEGVPSANYSSMDQFKFQSLFAQYYEGYGWFGNLLNVTPGEGYMLNKKVPSLNANFAVRA